MSGKEQMISRRVVNKELGTDFAQIKLWEIFRKCARVLTNRRRKCTIVRR